MVAPTEPWVYAWPQSVAPGEAFGVHASGPAGPAVVEVTPEGFDVVVEHSYAQSFSRAVDPYGMKVAYKHLRSGRVTGSSVTRLNGNYGFEDRPDGKNGKRCASRLRFEVTS